MVTEAAAVTESRRVPWFRRHAVQAASVALLGIAIFSLVYTLVPTLASPALLKIGPSPVFACNAREGDTAVADFVVTNVTSQPIRLLGLKAGCSCTASEGLPTQLAPGESGRVRLNVRVGHFDKTHMFTRSAEILANRDGTVPPLVVQVSESNPPRN